jgi:hypothetical protein
MRFWTRKKQQVEQAVDEVATATSDLVEKTAIIGPGGVLLLLGAAAVGAAATYYFAQTRQKKKAAQQAALPKPDKKTD